MTRWKLRFGDVLFGGKKTENFEGEDLNFSFYLMETKFFFIKELLVK